MRKFALIFGLAALSAASFASFSPRVAGSYRLVPNDETRQFCQRHHIALPTGRLTLREDNSFSLIVEDDEGTMRTRGDYEVEDRQVYFDVREGDTLHLPSSMRIDEEGLFGRGTEYDRVIDPPIVRPAPPVTPPVVTPVIPVRPVTPLYEQGVHASSIEGTWTLRGKKGEDASTRFTFRPDGTFRYRGESSASYGKYCLVQGGIELTWLEVDGAPLERGVTMRKTLPFAYSAEAFYVDTYRYERSNR